MGHTNSVLMAISKCPNPTIFQKTLGVNDFYFGCKDFEYPMGHISFVGKLDAITLKAGAPAIAPNFTLELMAKHSLDFWLTSEDLPDPNNRVTIGRDGKIALAYTPNNLEAHERLQAKLKHTMKQTGCAIHGHDCHQGVFGRNLYVGQRIPLAGVAHQNGTVRFGHDPKTSVLDANCKAHDLDNLYVVDGSFFPSSAAVNPALTIMANAIRVGEAYARLRQNKVEYASSGPQQLPYGNKNAAGISAFYFKDPDQHPLEILHFPRDKGLELGGKLFLGIDHSAIVVWDTDASVRFYRDLLGMHIAGKSENCSLGRQLLFLPK
jgi:hypothetical protein